MFETKIADNERQLLTAGDMFIEKKYLDYLSTKDDLHQDIDTFPRLPKYIVN